MTGVVADFVGAKESLSVSDASTLLGTRPQRPIALSAALRPETSRPDNGSNRRLEEHSIDGEISMLLCWC